MSDNALHYIFQALEQSCLDEGGDGDSMLLSDNFKVIAGKFEDWLKESNNTWWTKEIIDDKYIVFSHDQEAIWFSNDMSVQPFAMTVITCNWLGNRLSPERTPCFAIVHPFLTE